MLDNPDYIVSSGADTRVIWGCFLDVVNALACIGTAVALFPVVKRQNEALALGFVTTRMLEAAVIMIGVVSLLAVVTLRQDLAGATGADAATLVTTGRSPSDRIPALTASSMSWLMYATRSTIRTTRPSSVSGFPGPV